MRRYYGHRVTKRERAAVYALYAPRRTRENEHNAFSHSEQCDRYFAVVSSQVGGVAHDRCRCWCHGEQTLFIGPDGPEFDLTPPPEYANSADLAFIEGLSSSDREHPANEGAVVLDSRLNEIEARLVGPESLAGGSEEAGGVSSVAASFASLAPEFSGIIGEEFPQYAGYYDDEQARYVHGTYADNTFRPANKAGYSSWSPKELATGKCDVCGDKLADCECVE